MLTCGRMLRRRASNIPRLQRQPRRAQARLIELVIHTTTCIALQNSDACADMIRQYTLRMYPRIAAISDVFGIRQASQRLHPRRPRIAATRRTRKWRLRNQSFYSLVIIKPSQRLGRQLGVVKLIKQVIKQLNKISTRRSFIF